MGSALSAGLKWNNVKGSKKHKRTFRLVPVIMNREEVDETLQDFIYKPGTYLLYGNKGKDKMCLAFKTSDGKVAHYPIIKMNDLYYFNDFPFPYLESIVLYYMKYKFKDTKFTNQAFVDDIDEEEKERICKNRAYSLDALNSNQEYDNSRTWTYGHYKSHVTRL